MQEGVFAAYDLKNIEGIKSGLKDNPGSFFIRLISSRSDQVYLVDRKVISLPTYCFYIIKTGDYEIVRYGGSEYTAHLHIPPRYIRGLADEKSWEEAMKDNPSEQYVFVFIYGHKLFEKKIFDKLSELGVAKNEMLHGPIQYKNMDKPFQKEVDHPLELFFKNEQFYDQHEGRIVINTDNCALKQFLLDNTIDIGPLEDICVLFDHYPAGGIESFIDLDV